MPKFKLTPKEKLINKVIKQIKKDIDNGGNDLIVLKALFSYLKVKDLKRFIE